MGEQDEKVLDERCDNCGTRLKRYPIVDEDGQTDGHAVGCPNFYRRDNCQEVTREVRS